MNSQKSILIFLYIMGTPVNFLLCFETTSTKIGLEQTIEQQVNKGQLHHLFPDNLSSGQSHNRVLKRKRRYLEFPEGSSFQLVYDLIIGVVDFTNYLILGVTVALAWELPSKPPSEIFNDISERLKDGTLGTSRNDTIESIKYTDLHIKTTASKNPFNAYKYSLEPMFRTPMHYRYYTSQPSDNFYKYKSKKKLPNQYKSWSKKLNMFYYPQQTKWRKDQTHPKLYAKTFEYPWWNLNERLKNSLTSRPSIRRFDKNINHSGGQSNSKKPFGTYSTFRGTGRSEHRIYPVFGKRSIHAKNTHIENTSSHHHRYRRSGIFEDNPSKLDRIHIEYHRRSRHDLYQRIETYLNGRGSHGHHCVLRALCETGQKSNEHKPGSFVGELMRAIFTIPEPLNATVENNQRLGYKEQRYDTANALTEDCASRYSHCKDSLWSSHFVL